MTNRKLIKLSINKEPIFTLCAFIICQIGFGQIQESLSTPTQRFTEPDELFIHLPETDDTINLPFVDDFSDRSPIPSPLRWADRNVYINNTYGFNPPTMGVATFDGLDENGRPYDINFGQGSTACDILTSKHINLNNAQNVKLGFLYQEAGRGENPSNSDSLRLEFWSPLDTVWESVWGVTGTSGPFNRFQSVLIDIDDPKWLLKGFRFRFTSFGNPGGAFDVWNIDYVYLGENRTPNDTLPLDVAFIDQHQTLLVGGYESLPYWVYSANPTNFTRNQVTQSYKRNVPTGSLGAIILSGYRLTGQGLNINQNGNVNDAAGHGSMHFQRIEWDQAINQNFIPQLAPITGPFTLEMRSFFSGTAVGLRRNDTLVRRQHFGNYYAYDDGSAERAYGIANQPGAITLATYTLQANDTLKGLYLYFQPADSDPRNNAFQIVVYQNNSGVPGNKIYESDSLFVPRFSEHNQFIPFPIEDGPFLPSGSYYIGVKQRDAAKLNIGFDMNNANRNTLIYGDGSTWFASIFNGTLMMRPYFRTQAPEISVNTFTNKKVRAWKAYPNPGNGNIQISGFNGKNDFEVIDAVGKTLTRFSCFEGESINLHLPNGTYILRDKEGNYQRLIIINQ
jgi:hypothetical protein